MELLMPRIESLPQGKQCLRGSCGLRAGTPSTYPKIKKNGVLSLTSSNFILIIYPKI